MCLFTISSAIKHQSCLKFRNLSQNWPNLKKNENRFLKFAFLPLFTTIFRFFCRFFVFLVKFRPFLHIKKSKVKYAIPVFEVRRTGSLCPSFSGNRFYVVVCHCFPHRFTSLSLNRLSYSFVTCWVGMRCSSH